MRFEDAWLRYGRRSPWVLSDVNIFLAPGQVATVLGRNGAGKTTLLAAAAGLLAPDRGRVVDRPTRVGWVPERFPAAQPFTVRSYLVSMARVRGLTRPAAARQVDEWAHRLALEPFLGARLSEVSKGTAQKVGLIQALVPHPELLVLDEPWEGLDAQTRAEIPRIIAEVMAGGGSVLVSDHLGEVEQLPGAQTWHVEHGHVAVPETGHRAAGPGAGQDGQREQGQRERGQREEGQREGAQRAPDEVWVIEVAVAAPAVNAAVEQLRGQGHHVLAVRPSIGRDS